MLNILFQCKNSQVLHKYFFLLFNSAESTVIFNDKPLYRGHQPARAWVANYNTHVVARCRNVTSVFFWVVYKILPILWSLPKQSYIQRILERDAYQIMFCNWEKNLCNALWQGWTIILTRGHIKAITCVRGPPTFSIQDITNIVDWWVHMTLPNIFGDCCPMKIQVKVLLIRRTSLSSIVWEEHFALLLQ